MIGPEVDRDPEIPERTLDNVNIASLARWILNRWPDLPDERRRLLPPQEGAIPADVLRSVLRRRECHRVAGAVPVVFSAAAASNAPRRIVCRLCGRFLTVAPDGAEAKCWSCGVWSFAASIPGVG